MDYIEIIGLTAAALTTMANVPQAIKIIRTKSTKSISTLTYALLFVGVTTWCVYGVLEDDLPIILANGASALVACIILVMKLLAKKQENQNDDFPV